MRLAALVFDFDGIILESVNARTEAFRALALPWGEEAADALAAYHLKHGGVSRYLKFEWFFKEVLGKPLSEEGSQELGREFSRLCLEKVKAAPFVPGFLQVLSVAHGRWPLYVASGTPHDELCDILRCRELSGFFEGVFGTPPAKNELLQKAVAASGANPAEVMMIGDSHTDLEAALFVGTAFYGRGDYFKDKNVDWSDDLTGLAAHLAFLLSRG